MTCHHFTRPPESSENFIRNQMHSMIFCPFPQTAEKIRTVQFHSPRPLKHRFHQDSGKILRMGIENGFHFFPVLFRHVVPEWGIGTVQIRDGGKFADVRKEMAEGTGIKITVTRRQRENGFPMICVFQRQKMLLLRMPALRMILQTHFYGDFHRNTSVFRQKDPAQTGNGLRERGTEFRHRFRTAVRHDDVFKTVDLLKKGFLDSGMGVSQTFTPPGTDSVQDHPSILEEQFRSLGRFHRHGRKVRVILHLRAGMPEMAQIHFNQFICIHFLIRSPESVFIFLSKKKNNSSPGGELQSVFRRNTGKKTKKRIFTLVFVRLEIILKRFFRNRIMSLSSRGPGHQVLILVTRVRIPLGMPAEGSSLP